MVPAYIFDIAFKVKLKAINKALKNDADDENNYSYRP